MENDEVAGNPLFNMLPKLTVLSNSFSSITSRKSDDKSAATLASILQRYIESGDPSPGQKIHSRILKSGYVPNTNILIKTLILYIRTNSLRYARQVFDELPRRTISAYNYLIAAYLKEGSVEESIRLVQDLVRTGEIPDGFTLSMMLKVANSGGSSLLPRNVEGSVHAQMLRLTVESDFVLQTALVDAYVKKGRIHSARKVFDSMENEDAACSTSLICGYMNEGDVSSAEEIFSGMAIKDVVVFNAMIEGYSKSRDESRKALEIYSLMQESGFAPNISTFSSLIGACTLLPDADVNQQLHGQILKREFSTGVKMGSALINLYSKCGRTADARKVFDEMLQKNVFSWTSMIDGYGKNGESESALELFRQMKKEGIAPNSVTFLGALAACSHGNFVSEGREIFLSMESDFSVNPGMEHYACMVSLIGKSESVQEAFDFIMRMPIRPNSDVWNALLSCCSFHGDVEMAKVAAAEIFREDAEGRSGAYVSLSNAYASVGQWECVDAVRDTMHSRGIRKHAGCSY